MTRDPDAALRALHHRLAERLSSRAVQNARQAGLACAPGWGRERLAALLDGVGLPVCEAVLDAEALVGGAILGGLTYGVGPRLAEAARHSRDPALRQAALRDIAPEWAGHRLLRVREGGYPLLFVDEGGGLWEQHADRAPWPVFSDVVQCLEVAFLTRGSLALVVREADGDAVARWLGCEPIPEATRGPVQVWGDGWRDLGVLTAPGCPPEPYGAAPERMTTVRTGDSEVLSEVEDWARERGLACLDAG